MYQESNISDYLVLLIANKIEQFFPSNYTFFVRGYHLLTSSYSDICGTFKLERTDHLFLREKRMIK